MKTLNLSEIEIIPIKPRQGLLGFTSFVVNDALYIGNVALHSRPDGSIRLVFPSKALPNGKEIDVVHPITRACYGQILEEVTKVYQQLSEKVTDYGFESTAK